MTSSRKTKKKQPGNQPPAQATTQRTQRQTKGPRIALPFSPLDRQDRRWVGILLAVTVVAFLNALDGQFVYDDQFQILKNPMIRSLDNLALMFTQSVWQFMNLSAGESVGLYYRPLFNIALALNYHFFELNVFGWHLVSLLLHVIVTYLIFRIARQWGLRRELAFTAALLFGLHPVHSESVAWISGLPDPLAAALILPAWLLYEIYYHGRGGSVFLLLTSVGLAFLAMLSKEVVIVFPVFLVIREWLDRSPGEGLIASLTAMVKRVAPYAVLAALYVLIRYSVLGFISKTEPKAVGVPGEWVFLTIPSILLSYVRMLFIPYPLAVIYDHQYVTSAADPRFWVSGLAVAVIVIGACWLVRSSPVGRRALAWSGLFLLPVLNLKVFNPNESLLHDRYLYLPSIGFCLLVALGLDWIAARFPPRRDRVLVTASGIIGAVLLILTVIQNGFWQNDLKMINHALRLAPERPFLHNFAGAVYSQQGKRAEAEQAYLEALRIDPAYYDAQSNLGDIYREQGKLAEAEQAYSKAIEFGAPYAITYYNLGVTYTSLGKLAEAEAALRRALEIQPSNTDARYNLGWVYDNQGRTELAVQAYTETLRWKPSYPEPRINLGVLLTRTGRFQEAVEQLEIAQRYSPGHPVMLYALGDVYLKLNRPQDAVTTWDQLAHQDPQHRLVYTGLGLAYESMGNREQAKASFQMAIQVAPDETYTNVAREHLARLP